MISDDQSLSKPPTPTLQKSLRLYSFLNAVLAIALSKSLASNWVRCTLAGARVSAAVTSCKSCPLQHVGTGQETLYNIVSLDSSPSLEDLKSTKGCITKPSLRVVAQMVRASTNLSSELAAPNYGGSASLMRRKGLQVFLHSISRSKARSY